jgi:hypothetical protein
MKNVHLLPTDKPSRLFDFMTALVLTDNLSPNDSGTNHHIYITSSDEEIKEGDRDFYILANDRDGTWINRVEKVIECKIDPNHGKVLILSSGFIYIDEGCKIILTTDPDLIAEGVQPIDNEFLEWFVKNPSCEFVEVFHQLHKDEPLYQIILPQEEPKQELELKDFESGNILDVLNMGNVEYLGNGDIIYNPNLLFIKRDDKWFIKTEEPKQETLEETAKRLYEYQSQNPPYTIITPKAKIEGFIEGAKWQQERMYSEEDMIAFATFYYTHQGKATEYWGKDLFKEWFEQFKKK